MSGETDKYLLMAEQFRKREEAGIDVLEEGITFDDVIFLPGRSVVDSPDRVDTTTQLSDNITLHAPVMSANMDTVTGPEMAIAMSLNGGIGSLHRAMTVQDQVDAIQRVKDHHQYIIDKPPIITADQTVGRARQLMESHQRGYVVVLDQENALHGIVTTRDLKQGIVGHDQQLDASIFTSHEKGLVTASPDISMQDAQRLMWEHRVEKLILIDGDGTLAGVITDRDIRDIQSYPHATKDHNGRLQVLGSVGIGASAEEDAMALAEAGADGIIIDVLHGDTPRVLALTQSLRGVLPKEIPLIVGNVATAEQTNDLADAGANVVKVGWGPGGFCTTRVVTGSGRAQLKAVIECSAAAYHRNIKTIADGGIKYSGDIVKALYAGASAVMIGSMFIGAEESPGQVYYDENGARYKLGRGSASASASRDFAKAVGRQAKRRAPQGIEGVRIPYSGPISGTLFDLMDGTRNGIAAVGGKDIDTLRTVGRLERQSPATLSEGRPHIKQR